jgi:hypothetical protein
MQLCSLGGEELSLQVAVNGGGDGREGESAIIFPFPTIVTPAPTRSPITTGPIDYEFTMECLMETVKSSLVFDVPCDSVNFKTFSPQDLRRNVMFRFIVTNKSAEPIKISNLMMQSELINGPVQLASLSDGITIGVGGQRTWSQRFLVPFENFSDQIVEVDAAVNAVGANSANTRDDSDQYSLTVP